MSGVTYKKAGVNIEEGEKAVREIKEKVRSTHNQNVLTDLGSFGGMYKNIRGADLGVSDMFCLDGGV